MIHLISHLKAEYSTMFEQEDNELLEFLEITIEGESVSLDRKEAYELYLYIKEHFEFKD